MQDKPEDQSNDNQAEQIGERRDGELLRRYVQSRSEEAFAELGRRYAGLVYATCLRETDDRTLAEDAAQDVFVLLSQKAGALQRHASIAGWLFAAARFVCKNRMKQERRRRMNEAEALQQSIDLNTSALDIQDANDAVWERVEPHLHDALDRLKGEDREAVLLRFVAEQSFAQVGSRLGLSENTARMRVNRAIEKIRAHLGKAGVGISAVVLAALLEERAAHAAPAGLVHALPQIAAGNLPLSGLVANAPASVLPRVGMWRVVSKGRLLAGVGAALLCFIGLAAYRHTLPARLSDGEQRRLFAGMAGRWQGTLEYADDRTLQHFTYPTTVTVRLQNGGDGLAYTAAYAGTPSVDVTTLGRDSKSGKMIAQNDGPQSSHRLYATGELMRTRDGDYAFEGDSVAMDADVRLRIALKGNGLSVQEEYRKSGQTAYQFRNRFALKKQ